MHKAKERLNDGEGRILLFVPNHLQEVQNRKKKCQKYRLCLRQKNVQERELIDFHGRQRCVNERIERNVL